MGQYNCLFAAFQMKVFYFSPLLLNKFPAKVTDAAIRAKIPLIVNEFFIGDLLKCIFLVIKSSPTPKPNHNPKVVAVLDIMPDFDFSGFVCFPLK